MTAVITRNLRRSFEGRAVLANVDLEIESGEFVALLGRSGSGKSTILRALAGLDPDFDGEVLVPQRRSVVFQEARLLPWQRTLTNVTIGLRRTTSMTNAQIKARGTFPIPVRLIVLPHGEIKIQPER